MSRAGQQLLEVVATITDRVVQLRRGRDRGRGRLQQEEKMAGYHARLMRMVEKLLDSASIPGLLDIGKGVKDQ